MSTATNVLSTAQETVSTALATLVEYGKIGANWLGRTVVWLSKNGSEVARQGLSFLTARAKDVYALSLPVIKSGANWLLTPTGFFTLSIVGAGLFAYAANSQDKDSETKRDFYTLCGLGCALLAGASGVEAGLLPSKITASFRSSLASLAPSATI